MSRGRDRVVALPSHSQGGVSNREILLADAAISCYRISVCVRRHAVSDAIAESTVCLRKAIELYTEMGRLGMAARHIKVCIGHRVWDL